MILLIVLDFLFSDVQYHGNFYLFPAGIDLRCQLKFPLSSVYSQTINKSTYHRNLGHTPHRMLVLVRSTLNMLFPFLFPPWIQIS